MSALWEDFMKTEYFLNWAITSIFSTDSSPNVIMNRFVTDHFLKQLFKFFTRAIKDVKLLTYNLFSLNPQKEIKRKNVCSN
jgi:hypothetical protein